MLAPIDVQVVEEGYEFFSKRQLVTIFSAPNYCGEFENAGAMMSVDETLMCSFQVSRNMGTHVSTYVGERVLLQASTCIPCSDSWAAGWSCKDHAPRVPRAAM